MPIPERLRRIEPIVRNVAACYRVDPVLVLAICDRESLGGGALDADGKGDKGHGHGPMQIDNRAHPSFLGAVDDTGRPLWRDDVFNVAYACRLLARLMREFPSDLRAAVAAYNTGAGNVRKSHRLGRDVDTTTAHGNYSADVLRRRDEFLAP